MCDTTTDKPEQSYHSVHTEVDFFLLSLFSQKLKYFRHIFPQMCKKSKFCDFNCDPDQALEYSDIEV